MDNDGSRRLSETEFQVVRPATEIVQHSMLFHAEIIRPLLQRPYYFSVEQRLDDV